MKLRSPFFLPFFAIVFLGLSILATHALQVEYRSEHIFIPITEGVGHSTHPFTSFILAYQDTGTVAAEVHHDHVLSDHANHTTTDVQLFYQYRTINNVWSPESALYTNTDMEDETGKVYSRQFFTEPALELRVIARDQQGHMVSFESSYMEAIAFHTTPRLSLRMPSVQATSFVVSREEWGADNALITDEGWNAARTELCKTKSWYCTPASPEAIAASREKQKQLEATYPEDTKTDGSVTEWNGKELYWTVRKSAKVKKLFVHHTASLNKDQNNDGVINQTDEKLIMQSTYYFHTILRGWGDIGYNYIVGPSGTIYEGRFGGDRAVGAHAVWRNISSIGVSVMGNFQDEYMSTAQKDALVSALAALAQYYGLDPAGNTTFYNITAPSILGHRDSDEAATACPGTHIYEILPDIRKQAKERLATLGQSPVLFPGFATSMEGYVGIVDKKWETQTFAAATAKTLRIRIKNTGGKIWDSATLLQLKSPLGIFAVESGNKSEALIAKILKPTGPGEIAEFDVTLKPGLSGYNGNLTFQPLANGKFLLQEVTIPVSIPAAKATFQEVALEFSKQAGYMIGEQATGNITIKNTGDVTWEKDGTFRFSVDLIGSTNNTTFTSISSLQLQSSVAPGSTVTLPFQFTAPLFQGVYFVSLVPKIQNYSLLLGAPVRKTLPILHPSQVSDLSLSLSGPARIELATGSKKDLVLTLKNSGPGTIPDLARFTPEVRLGSNAQSAIFAGTATWVQNTLPANGEVSIRVPLEARSDDVEVTTTISVVLNTLPLTDQLHSMVISVPKKVLTASMTLTTQESLQKGSPSPMTVRLSNTGTVAWPEGTRINTKQGSSFYSNPTWHGPTTLYVLEEELAPGQSRQFERLILPSLSGTLIEEFVLVFPNGDQLIPSGNKLNLKIQGDAPVWMIPLEFGTLLTRWK